MAKSCIVSRSQLVGQISDVIPPLKVSLIVQDMEPHLIRGSLDPCNAAPNGILIGSAIFELFTIMSNIQTHRFTHKIMLCVTYITTNYIYALRTGYAA